MIQLITKRLVQDLNKLEAGLDLRTEERDRYRDLAGIDDLTGLYNEAALRQRLGIEWSRACRFGAGPISLIAVALAPSSDAMALRTLAEIVRGVAARSCDVLGRCNKVLYALLPGTNYENARRLARDIETAARAAGLAPISAVVARSPDRSTRSELLLADADASLAASTAV